tara:strand:+ start:195 stop:485 length:291 start_codon:yes stop_codon:yes gene_type:complete
MKLKIKDFKINNNLKKKIPEPTFIPINTEFNLNDLNSKLETVIINKKKYMLGNANKDGVRNVYSLDKYSFKMEGVIVNFKKEDSKNAIGKFYRLNV